MADIVDVTAERMEVEGLCEELTYSDMVSAAMRSELEAQPWYDYLKQLQARRDAERALINEWRRKHPGMADFEIIAKAGKWLDENYPVPDLQGEPR